MNYLNIIELMNKMDKAVVEVKLITYTKKFKENSL